MKKILTTIVALAITSAFAVDVNPLNPKTATLEDYKAVLALALAQTNREVASTILFKSKIHLAKKCFIGKFAEEDALFASRLIRPPKSMNLLLPLSWNKLTRPTIQDTHPNLLKLVDKYNIQFLGNSIFQCDVEYSDIFTWLEYWTFENESSSMDLLEKMAVYVQKKAITTIRKYLRKSGKGFVTVNGVNPCEKYLKELADGLNSPRLEGFVKWLSDMGVEDKIDVSWIPSAKELEALKNRILDADEELTPKSQKLLRIGLGSDGYNAFVKEYNGEK